MKIISHSELCAVWVTHSCDWLNTKPVGVSLLTNAVCHSPLMKLAHSHREPRDCLMVPTLRVVTHSMMLCVIQNVVHAVRLCDPREMD
jgi:hypothetical protein